VARAPAVIVNNTGETPRRETPSSPPVQQQVQTPPPAPPPAASQSEGTRQAPTKVATGARGVGRRVVGGRPTEAPQSESPTNIVTVPERDRNGAPILAP